MAGNTDMSGTNGHFSDDARFAALSQRVSGIETSVQNLSTQFSQFVAKLDDRQRTPWGLIVSISVALLAYVTTIGGLAYAPVWAGLSKADAAIAKLADTSVTQQEMQWRTARGAEDRALTQGAISDIRKDQVPRGELERVWANYDQRFIDQQRQLDVLSTNYNNTYNPRDAIQDMRERIDRLERLKQASAPPG